MARRPKQLDMFTVKAKHDHGCKVAIRIPSDWLVDAEFDGPNDCYRYTLMHRWGPGEIALIALKNPSGATKDVGDQTVMKTARIFRRMGYGGQIVVNTCAYRHVDPKALLTVEDPVGPGNHKAILHAAAQCSLHVIAHGILPGGLQRHADRMCALLQESGHDLHVLKLSKDGIPMHPLSRGRPENRVPEDVVPMRWLMGGERAAA